LRTFLSRIVAVAALILVVSPQTSHACDCLRQISFEEQVPYATVISGEVQSYGPKLPHGADLYATMVVKINNVIKGSFDHGTITLVGDRGYDCQDYIYSGIYSLGSKHLFVILPNERVQGLGHCSEPSLRIIDNKVHGFHIRAGKKVSYSNDYDEFIASIKASE